MQNFPDLRRWLSNGISEDFFMLHGTSEQAVLEAINSGKLPTGVFYPSEVPIHDQMEGRLFFVPVSSKFKGRKYNNLEKKGKEACIKDAKTYAEPLGFIHYMAEKLQCRTSNTYTLLRHLELGSIGWEDTQEGLRRDGINASMRQLQSLYSHAEQRKGVLIEPNEQILSLKHEVICTDIIAIDCPDGLDKEFIKGIELLGPIEKKLMDRFLDGKLEYEGFKAERQDVY